MFIYCVLFVAEAFNQNGSICVANYSEFLLKHGIPVPPKEFSIVAEAVIVLFKGFCPVTLSLPFMDICQSFIGQQCLSSK